MLDRVVFFFCFYFLLFFCVFFLRSSLGKLWINNYPSRAENSCWQLSIFTPIINHFLLLLFSVSLSLFYSTLANWRWSWLSGTLAVAWIVSGARHDVVPPHKEPDHAKEKCRGFSSRQRSAILTILLTNGAQVCDWAHEAFCSLWAILAPLAVVIVFFHI